MSIRIRLFLIILCISLLPLIFVFFLTPQFSHSLFTDPSAPLLLVLFMLVILITLSSLFMAVYFTLPLTQLREIARKVQSGEFSSRVNIKKGDEIGELGLAFNTMLDTLQNQQSSLQNKISQATSNLNEKVKTLEDTKKATLNLLEDLEEEKAKDEAILSSIGDGLIVTDKEGRILMVNKSFTDLLGWQVPEVYGKDLAEVVPLFDEDRPVPKTERLITKTLTQRIKTTTTTTTTTSYQRKDKTTFSVAIIVSPIILGGQITGAVEVFRDITREKEVDKAKSEFVSLASHQLRTPLGITKWYLEVLQKDNYLCKAPKTVQDYFYQLSKNNERVLSLVRELLSVSRIDQGKVKNAPVQVDIALAITNIVKDMQLLAQKKKITLSLVFKQQTLPGINLDPLLFHEVIENLIANAIEYTPDSGKVEVSTSQNDGMLTISVQDTGIGISPEDQKNLFTKFFRAQKAVLANPEGSGLGLYVVKSYIEGWGGRITVQSIEGKGSAFIISLPISQI